MKVNVYSKNGVLLKEFGDDPGESSRDGVRTVSEYRMINERTHKLTFDDGLFPEAGYIRGEVIVIGY